MEDRIVALVRGLRAAGLPVSPAEAAEAGRAALAVGLGERETFRLAVRACLAKDAAALPVFDALFPAYFGGAAPPLDDVLSTLDAADREEVEAFIAELRGRLRRLLEWLLTGAGPAPAELAERAARTASAEMDPRRLTHRMLRDLGLRDLEDVLAALRDRLREAGVSRDVAEQVTAGAEANAAQLAEAVARAAGLALARAQYEEPRAGAADAIADIPIEQLSAREAELVRREVGRMVARLRTRTALRQRRAARGALDPRATLRASQRTGGVPFRIAWHRKRRKPSLVLLCDVSTSMRPFAHLTLRILYELHDQVARARSFAFNDDLEEVTELMLARRPDAAAEEVLRRIPPGYYATDLGRSLVTFEARHAAAVDRRTTVIVLGDGRNNLRAPRADLLAGIGRRARRLVWLNPEPPGHWGQGDSDMLAYAPVCSETACVSTLRELARAVDDLFH